MANDHNITSLEFSSDGEMLAIGDEAGRVIVLSTAPEPTSRHGLRKAQFLLEFQSHLKGFDQLNSKDIPEKVICIEWLRREPHRKLLLTCNDGTVKLWKISKK